jgi:hypothetical protein
VKSGDLDPASLARQSSIPRSGSFTEARRVSLEGWTRLGNGSVGRPTVAGARAAAGTPCAGQTPVISCSGEVESARGRTAEALAGFIGVGVGRGHGRGLARRGARAFGRPGVLWQGQGVSNTWRCVSALVQTPAEIANVRILAKIRRRPLPGTYGYLLYVSSKER